MVYVNFQSYNWNIKYIYFLNYSFIPSGLIKYFSTKYYSNLYLYNYHINNENINILSWRNKKYRSKLMHYQYTPQILNNILYKNDYIDIYTNNIFVISLYHHLVLIKYMNIHTNIRIGIDININTDIDNNVYYLGLYFNYHLYVTNVYWDKNKQFCSSNKNENIHEIQYDLILNQQYINSKIDELNCLIKAKELLNKL